jgi:hypothetical protein
LQNPRLY